MLGFSRLSAAAYAVIIRVVDDDGIFRARVAESATEHVVGRVGWLWLHRPVGWLDELATMGGTAAAAPVEPVAAARSKRDQRAAEGRLRKAAAEADAARRRAADQASELRKAEATVRAERDALAAELATLRDERNAAVRRSKDLEATLAEARRDLKVARQATMDAEAELQAARTGGAAVAPARAEPDVAPTSSPAPASASLSAPPPAAPPFDRVAVGASVSAAARAAADLAAALAGAAAALADEPATDAAAPVEGGGSRHAPTAAKGSKKRAKGQPRPGARAHPSLPPGVFDGTPEADRHLIGSRSNLLVVDGYNLARAAWSGLDPQEERRRTVSLLDDVQARSGAKVIVVFDGDSAVTAPKASKNVVVRFSATGQTADDAIAELLEATPRTKPVIVVSADRAVAADARRQGAVAMGCRAFLAAAGR